jgi:hypothetical protein
MNTEGFQPEVAALPEIKMPAPPEKPTIAEQILIACGAYKLPARLTYKSTTLRNNRVGGTEIRATARGGWQRVRFPKQAHNCTFVLNSTLKTPAPEVSRQVARAAARRTVKNSLAKQRLN